MTFDDLIGQRAAIDSLRSAIDHGRLPHALLIGGAEGTGGLPLAWAAAQYILCTHRDAATGRPCGTCPDCVQAQKAAHPDLHFVYPVVNKSSGATSSVSDDYAAEWREALTADPYLTLADWVARSGGGDSNKQAQIFVTEAAAIIRTLSTKPLQSDYRIMILWMPELMKEDAANKLLKIIEEPYERTHFLLVSAQPERIIGTIQSRVQRLNLPPLDEATIASALTGRFQCTERKAADMARIAHGSYVAARQLLHDDEERQLHFDRFCRMMRSSYGRRLFEMKAWSDEMAALTRERQCSFLQYAQGLIRENFIMNFGHAELNYMTEAEAQFSARFSPFVRQDNIAGIMEQLARAEQDVRQNVNSKMVFFDLSLRLIMLLKAA